MPNDVRHLPTLPTNILGQLVRKGYRIGGSTPGFNQHLNFLSPEFRAELADNDVFQLRSHMAASTTENKAPLMISLASTPVPDTRIKKRRGRPPNNNRNKVKNNNIPNAATDIVESFFEIDDPGIDNSEDNWIHPVKHYKVYAAETKNVSCLRRSPTYNAITKG